MSEQKKPQMSVVPVNEVIQRGDFAMLPGCEPKPVTELTGEWVGCILHRLRGFYGYDHPCHTMVILRPQLSPEPQWFDLTPFGEHVLRFGIDQEYKDGNWFTGNWPKNFTVAGAECWGYTQFRCLLKDAPPELVAKAKEPQQPKTETVVFYEYMVRCGIGNEDWQLKWRTSKPKTNNWIPTGNTETREVVR